MTEGDNGSNGRGTIPPPDAGVELTPSPVPTLPTADLDAAVSFLRGWAEEGPWLLTAIEPDRKGIESRCFGPGEEPQLRAWLARWGGTRNCYFAVNPVIRRVDKKAERENVAALSWLHVDIDPRTGEDLARERERALALLRNPPADIPPPTVVIDSGGGFQGFWRLAAPYAINGDESRYEEAKRWNQELERLFGADPCHNVDRIMRLPGTINWPDAKKKRKGRQVALAQLVAFDVERVYRLDQFRQAPIGANPGAGNTTAPASLDTANVRRFGHVDELDPLCRTAPPTWVKVMIVQGNLPDEPTKYPSRSEALFAVCCELVRCGAADDTIYSVITDRDFGISASVLDKKSSAEKYALRQIERARAEAEVPELAEMNARYAVVVNVGGGKCRVLSEVRDEALARTRYDFATFDDVRNAWRHRRVQVGTDKAGNPVYKLLGAWWLDHAQRRQYDRVVFAPGEELPEGGDVYNLWRGMPVAPVAGDWTRLREHLLRVIAAGDQASYDYVIRWCAWAVQNPGSPAEVALVLRGGRGAGKGMFARALCRLFGQHALHVSSIEHLVGRFNAHLRDVCLLFADEAYWPGDHGAEGAFKRLITEPTLTIEQKGIDATEVRNCLHVVMASNEAWVVPAGMDERRFAVLDVSDEHKQDEAWFGPIVRELEGGGLAAMLHDLLTMPLGDWHPRRDVPRTKALLDQKRLSLRGMDLWFHDLLSAGELPESDERLRAKLAVSFNTLLRAAQDHAQLHRQPRPTHKGLSTYLKERGLIAPRDTAPRRHRVFPPLAEVRAAFDARMGGAAGWEEPADEDEWGWAWAGAWEDQA